MNSVRFGLIGLGSMGAVHARMLLDGRFPRATLTAVCDPEENLQAFEPAIAFPSSEALIRSGEVDAVVVATPHYSHTPIGIDVLSRGLHLLVEKPVSVHKADCERLFAAHTDPNVVFGAMFNQRTNAHYLRLRDLILSGDLGEIRRVQWTVTNWFRSQAYYNSGGWRATWAGEGGGVLLNQCPHNLDMLTWIFGMPVRVQAHCHQSRYHDIEVEDDVTAYLEFANGATGLFVTSTGEAPGTNRLEISCDQGRVVLENGRLRWDRTEVSIAQYTKETPERWAGPPVWEIQIPVQGKGEQHAGIFKNFVAAILDGTPLIAPAKEGLHSVELANAMIYSSHLKQMVDLPLDAAAYEAFLQEKIRTSTFVKTVVKQNTPRDLANSFGGL